MLVATGSLGDGCRRAPPRCGGKSGFDLAQLNAQPAHLHLVITTPEVLDIAGSVDAHHIPVAYIRAPDS